MFVVKSIGKGLDVSKQNRYLSAVFLLTVRGLEAASCGLFFIPDWWPKGTSWPQPIAVGKPPKFFYL